MENPLSLLFWKKYVITKIQKVYQSLIYLIDYLIKALGLNSRSTKMGSNILLKWIENPQLKLSSKEVMKIYQHILLQPHTKLWSSCLVTISKPSPNLSTKIPIRPCNFLQPQTQQEKNFLSIS